MDVSWRCQLETAFASLSPLSICQASVACCRIRGHCDPNIKPELAGLRVEDVNISGMEGLPVTGPALAGDPFQLRQDILSGFCSTCTAKFLIALRRCMSMLLQQRTTCAPWASGKVPQIPRLFLGLAWLENTWCATSQSLAEARSKASLGMVCVVLRGQAVIQACQAFRSPGASKSPMANLQF